jgi:CRISPR-associated exonuclease Cas4
MEETITMAELNDFIFCPVSIYFHNLYGDLEKLLYQEERQLLGSEAHRTLDTNKYSSKKNILQGEMVYSSTYNILGKIDIFDIEKGILTERKKMIKEIYDGYILQLYAQYFALKDMGYKVNTIRLYSMDDNKNYYIELPENNVAYLKLFEETINSINKFDFDLFKQTNESKCKNCIYSNLCDRSLV